MEDKLRVKPEGALCSDNKVGVHSPLLVVLRFFWLRFVTKTLVWINGKSRILVKIDANQDKYIYRMLNWFSRTKIRFVLTLGLALPFLKEETQCKVYCIWSFLKYLDQRTQLVQLTRPIPLAQLIQLTDLILLTQLIQLTDHILLTHLTLLIQLTQPIQLTQLVSLEGVFLVFYVNSVTGS